MVYYYHLRGIHILNTYIYGVYTYTDIYVRCFCVNSLQNFCSHLLRDIRKANFQYLKTTWSGIYNVEFIGGVGQQLAEYEPAACPGGQEDQQHPGLYQK